MSQENSPVLSSCCSPVKVIEVPDPPLKNVEDGALGRDEHLPPCEEDGSQRFVPDYKGLYSSRGLCMHTPPFSLPVSI